MLKGSKRAKYKKTKKGKIQALEFKANALKFGTVGLKASESGILHPRQIEAARRAITRTVKKKGKVWIRIFPYVPVTRKSKGSRMGKGKGSVSHWVAKVVGGNVLFEVCGAKRQDLKQALKSASKKLPIKSIIFR